jgi:UDP-N-acetylglucosamine--N-acetylmuramyl-(pentapeptide) pyrophosphoryl-undecaprenol N-acetylglucosamine transferase
MTVAEVSAVGLPAIFVPLPIGNGEQALNGQPVVNVGGALMINDADLTPEKVREVVLPLLTNPHRLQAMSAATHGTGHRAAADVLARMVLDVVGK